MKRAWASALAVSGMIVLGTGAGAMAKHTGSGNGHHGNNKGDAWLDNSGEQPSAANTPGHEMDPHLTCDDLELWGDKMAFSSGTYTITGQRPTGSGKVDWSGTWSYDRSKGGNQVMDSIDVAPLIQHAEANGDRAHNKQGFHFKLQLKQLPQKHKTFWIKCTNGSF
jgi:hypothetical protein